MRITELNYDVLENIDQYLDRWDRRVLATTCVQFMKYLQERAYNTVELREDSSSGNALLALASGPRARLVKRIQYRTADVKDDVDNNEESEESTSKNSENSSRSDDGDKEYDRYIKDDADNPIVDELDPFSDETRDIMQSLSRFPNLETFEFITHHWNIGGWKNEAGEDTLYFGFEHPPYHFEAWYGLIDDSLDALSKNRDAFSHLKIRGSPPTCYDGHSTEDWYSMLDRLKSLEIQLPEFEESWDGRNGGLNWCDDSYLDPLLPDFLMHLPNVEHLHIAGKKDGTIGNDDKREPVRWGEARLPKLKTFQLEWCVIEEQVLKFLQDHSPTLEEVRLLECIAGRLSWWSALFKQTRESQSIKLIEFQATQAPPKLHEEDKDTYHGQFFAANFSGEYGEVILPHAWPEADSDEEDDDHLDDVLAELSKVQAMVVKNKSTHRGSAGDV